VEQVARIIDHRVKELFPDGAVARAELLRDGDAPGQLTVRVFVPATEDLAGWAATHRQPMENCAGSCPCGPGSASCTCTASRSAPQTRTYIALSARSGCQAMTRRWRASGSSSGRTVAMPSTQRLGERVDKRIRDRTAGGMTVKDLRTAAVELLPLDADRHEDALVYLAFLAQAAVVPELAEAAEGAAQRLQEPLAARIAYAVRAGGRVARAPGRPA
jgi:transcriptional regulator BetI-like protein